MTYYGNYLGPQNLVNPNDIQIITTSTALGQTSYGVTYLIQASGSTTITLPVLLAGSITQQIILVNDSSTGTVTINTSGTNQIRVLGVATNTFTLTSGDTVVIENNGTTWSIVDNSSWKANLASPSFTGSPTAPTATVGTNSTQLANTAFVQRALGNNQAFTILTTTQTLTPSQSGMYILPSAASLTFTLPAASTTATGSIFFIGGNGLGVTIGKNSADTMYIGPGSSATSIAVAANDKIALISNPTSNTWTAVGGETSLKGSTAFSSSISANGWQKLPSGIIVQWGSFSYTGASGTTQLFSFPVAYPNTAMMATGSIGSVLGTSNMGFQTSSATQFQVGYYNSAGTAASATAFMWVSTGY
jgi:hypothetical protein